MGVSIILASIIAVIVQKEKILDVIKYLILGFYKFDGTPLEKIIKGEELCQWSMPLSS